MDGFEFDNVKAEKANAMLRYRRLRNIPKLFRIVELGVALVFLSWTFTRLPFAVRTSGQYFRLLVGIVVSPLFIFLLSNLIVLTLFLKSDHSITDTNSGVNLYESFVNNSQDHINLGPDYFRPSPPKPEEIVFLDKQIISQTNPVLASSSDGNVVAKADNVEVVDSAREEKGYERSKSENLRMESSEENCWKLRLSETEICRELESSGMALAGGMVDRLSSEEFQRIIEAFIAKQVKFHRDEKSFTVLHANA